MRFVLYVFPELSSLVWKGLYGVVAAATSLGSRPVWHFKPCNLQAIAV